jgi:hypothetical protein
MEIGWEELRQVTRLLKSTLRLPGDIGFKWPSPRVLPPLPRQRQMEVTKIFPHVPVERRDVLLSFEEIEMLVDSMDEYYQKYMRKIARTEQPRSKKESIELGRRQELFQRLARARNAWENPPDHPDYPENVNQP